MVDSVKQGSEQRMDYFLVTGNRLRDGAVIWLSVTGGWVENIAEAALLSAEAADAAVADAATQARTVVSPYKIEARLVGGEPLPRRFRERIRALGPSVRPDLSKKAASGRHLATD